MGQGACFELREDSSSSSCSNASQAQQNSFSVSYNQQKIDALRHQCSSRISRRERDGGASLNSEYAPSSCLHAAARPLSSARGVSSATASDANPAASVDYQLSYQGSIDTNRDPKEPVVPNPLVVAAARHHGDEEPCHDIASLLNEPLEVEPCGHKAAFVPLSMPHYELLRTNAAAE